MAKWRCSLCGGKLSEGRCILCGLDNTIYKRKTAYSGGASQEESRQKQKQQSYSAGRAVRPANNRKTKSGRLTIIVILLIIMFSFLPTIIEVVQTVIQDISSDSGSVFDTFSYFGDSYDDEDVDYDPYEYVTREIPDTGESADRIGFPSGRNRDFCWARDCDSGFCQRVL